MSEKEEFIDYEVDGNMDVTPFGNFDLGQLRDGKEETPYEFILKNKDYDFSGVENANVNAKTNGGKWFTWTNIPVPDWFLEEKNKNEGNGAVYVIRTSPNPGKSLG